MNVPAGTVMESVVLCSATFHLSSPNAGVHGTPISDEIHPGVFDESH